MESKVLCGASADKVKYYFNPEFDNLPDSVKEELRAITVVFADRVGATLLMVFAPDGQLQLNVIRDEGDLGYDEIETELQIRALQREKEELFTQLETYYGHFFLNRTE